MNDRNSLSPASAPGSVPATSLQGASLRGGVGARLRRERELRGMSIEEIGRATRIPLVSLEKLESDRFDDLPGEVFVRGFLRGYAKAVGLSPEEVLAWYGASRRVPLVAPIVPVSTHVAPKERRRVGIAVAFVLLLVLCTMALSFILRPRGRDVPSELSMGEHGQPAGFVAG